MIINFFEIPLGDEQDNNDEPERFVGDDPNCQCPNCMAAKSMDLLVPLAMEIFRGQAAIIDVTDRETGETIKALVLFQPFPDGRSGAAAIVAQMLDPNEANQQYLLPNANTDRPTMTAEEVREQVEEQLKIKNLIDGV